MWVIWNGRHPKNLEKTGLYFQIEKKEGEKFRWIARKDRVGVIKQDRLR